MENVNQTKNEDYTMEINSYKCSECGKQNNMQDGQPNRCSNCDALHNAIGKIQMFKLNIKPTGGFLTGDIKNLEVTETQLKDYLGLGILQYESWYKILASNTFDNGIITYKWVQI
jgi:hypothetical protein